MKVEFWCDSGANIHSCRKETVDTSDFGITDEQWIAMDEDARQKVAEEWAYDRLDIGFREAK